MPVRILAIFTLLACAASLWAQSWDGLSSLNPGERVTVLEKSGREHKGVFRSVSTQAISIEERSSQVAIERARVRRVQAGSHAHRVRNLLIGAGIGLAIGLTVDQTLGTFFRNEGHDSGRAVTYIAPIAVFGAIGAALPGHRTVYRAP